MSFVLSNNATQWKRDLLCIMIIVSLSIIYTLKLFSVSPWIGSDTHPFYPLTPKDFITILFSPWDFRHSRTVLGNGLTVIYYLLYQLFYIVSKSKALWLVATFWIAIAGINTYLLLRFVFRHYLVACIGSFAYISTSFTWHEAVNSVYAMLPAYAMTPLLFLCMVKMFNEFVTISRDLWKIMIKYFVLLTSIIFICKSLLYPYYAIAITLLIPIVITYMLTSVNLNSLHYHCRILIASLLLLMGISIPYIISIFSITVTNKEILGLTTMKGLANVKFKDFVYNYSHMGSKTVLFPLYIALSTLLTLLSINGLLFLVFSTLISIMLLASIIASIKVFEDKTYDTCIRTVSITSFLGYAFTLALILMFRILASHAIHLLKVLFNIIPIAAFLGALTEPIKIGIPLSLFQVLMISNLFYSLCFNIKCKHRETSLDKMRSWFKFALKVIIICIVVMLFTINALYLPVSAKLSVKQLYYDSMKLLIYNQNLNGLSYAFHPFVYINIRGLLNKLMYYYTYGYALRPLSHIGYYSKILNVGKELKLLILNKNNTCYKDLIAKAYYVDVYVSSFNKEIQKNTFYFKQSPIYVVIPVNLPMNSSTVLKISEMSNIVSVNMCLKILNSYVVIMPAYLYQSLFPSLPVFNYSINAIKRLVCDLLGLKISTKVSFLPLEIITIIKDVKSKTLILRLNELFSPYWNCECLYNCKCEKMNCSLFNTFIIRVHNVSKPVMIRIYHKLWHMKILISVVQLTFLLASIFFVFKCKFKHNNINT